MERLGFIFFNQQNLLNKARQSIKLYNINEFSATQKEKI